MATGGSSARIKLDPDLLGTSPGGVPANPWDTAVEDCGFAIKREAADQGAVSRAALPARPAPARRRSICVSA